MALTRTRLSEMPTDAVLLNEEEAVKYQFAMLNKWNNLSDVFAYKYGSVILGNATILSSIYIANYYRRKFKLLHYGRIASYLPLCIVPASVTVLLHQGLVTKELVLLKKEQCPICIQLRAAVIQSTMGCVLPLILAPLSSIALAHTYGTFNMPYITQEPKEVFKLIKKQMKPMKKTLFGMVIVHALLGSITTYFEAESIYKVNIKMMELEKELELTDKL